MDRVNLKSNNDIGPVLCDRCILPSSLRHHEVAKTTYAASRGERESQRIYGFSQRVQLVISELRFAHRTAYLKPSLRHHFQHLPSVITNPGSLKTVQLLPPSPRILTQLVWSGTRHLHFSRLLLCVRVEHYCSLY